MQGGGWYKSRILGHKSKKGRDDTDVEEGSLFAGTPERRTILFPGRSAATLQMIVTTSYAECAYYQADALKDKDGTPQVMEPPKDVEPLEVLWVLERAMPGTRPASRSWQDHVDRVLTSAGGEFERCPLDPCYYENVVKKCRTCVHGGDVNHVLPREQKNWIFQFSKHDVCPPPFFKK